METYSEQYKFVFLRRPLNIAWKAVMVLNADNYLQLEYLFFRLIPETELLAQE